MPFESLNVSAVYSNTCCPNWHHPSRHVFNKPEQAAETWNSTELQGFRLALLNGDDRFCKKCPYRNSPARRTQEGPDDKVVMDKPPRTLTLVNDPSCNLTCPSCRVNRKVSVDSTPVDKILGGFIEPPPLVICTTSGDPFASRAYMDWLKTPSNHPDGFPHVILWTNGLLLSRSWPKVRRKVTMLVISVDATTQDVYEKLRRGGSWDNILREIRFAAGLRSLGEIASLQWNMVVQVDNYHQMGDFVDLALRHEVDEVQFCAIAPWNHITQDEWARMNVCGKDHPEHGKFLEALDDPRLCHPVANTSALEGVAREVVADAVR